jgi:hypothetical protein
VYEGFNRRVRTVLYVSKKCPHCTVRVTAVQSVVARRLREGGRGGGLLGGLKENFRLMVSNDVRIKIEVGRVVSYHLCE